MWCGVIQRGTLPSGVWGLKCRRNSASQLKASVCCDVYRCDEYVKELSQLFCTFKFWMLTSKFGLIKLIFDSSKQWLQSSEGFGKVEMKSSFEKLFLVLNPFLGNKNSKQLMMDRVSLLPYVAFCLKRTISTNIVPALFLLGLLFVIRMSKMMRKFWNLNTEVITLPDFSGLI